MRLSDKQFGSIREATAQVNLWHGAIRSGKTIGSLIRWLLFVAAAPSGGALVIVGRTRDHSGTKDSKHAPKLTLLPAAFCSLWRLGRCELYLSYHLVRLQSHDDLSISSIALVVYPYCGR